MIAPAGTCASLLWASSFKRDYLDWLRAGDVDVIVGWLPVSPPEFTVGPVVFRDSRVLMVARGHPLAKLDSVTLEDLADYPVSDIPAFNREMMDSFIPPKTPSGRTLHRVIPFSNLPRCEAVLVWCTAGHTPRLNAFTRTAADVLADQ